jgi:hypothetical protein
MPFSIFFISPVMMLPFMCTSVSFFCENDTVVNRIRNKKVTNSLLIMFEIAGNKFEAKIRFYLNEQAQTL